ncbi:MAG: hypothetical protein ACEQSA_05085 [Weeksellaceae bacterium]
MRKLLLILFAFLLLATPAMAQIQHSINVSATVPPDVADFELSIEADVPADTVLTEGDEVTFTINYRTNATSGTYDTVIVGSWEEGLVIDSSGYLDVYDYVINSATDAHDGTPPVIDLINRTITWNISGLDYSATPHSVSFTLRVKSGLPTFSLIEVYTNADADFAGVTIPQEEYRLYVQKTAVNPTPTAAPTAIVTATPGPSATGGPAPSSTPGASVTPTPPFIFVDIDIDEVTNDAATIRIETNQPSTLQLTYYPCADPDTKLTQSSSSFARRHTVRLEALSPDTEYCFVVTATNASGTKITSDIFTFKTALRAEKFKVTESYVSWNNIVLSTDLNHVIAVKKAPLNFRLRIDNPDELVKIHGSFVSTEVLGVQEKSFSAVGGVDLIEISPGVFSAEILAPEVLGQYMFSLELQDTAGNTSKRQLPMRFFVSDKLQIVDAKTKQPVEDATLSLDRYQENLKLYASFNKSFGLQTENTTMFAPFRSDSEGGVMLLLPLGKYKAQIQAPGYEAYETEFRLDLDTDQYPVISIKRSKSMWKVGYIFSRMHESLAFTLSEYFSTKVFWHFMLIKTIFISLFFIVLLYLYKRYWNNLSSQQLLREILVWYTGLVTICLLFESYLFTIYHGFDRSWIFIILFICYSLLFLYFLKKKLTYQKYG